MFKLCPSFRFFFELWVMKRMFYVLIGCLLAACTSESGNKTETLEKCKPLSSEQLSLSKKAQDSISQLCALRLDSALLIFDLMNVQLLNNKIWVDLKYASTDNFVKIKMYEKLDRAFLQKDVAERLAKCQEYLTQIDTGLHLLVYDAVRPVSVQWKMWNALDTIPAKERGKFVSNPLNRSVHNYGAAVDVTICNSNRKPLDMGAGYDDIREIAYPSLEQKFLSSGELTKKHIANRNLLRKVMRSQSFRNIPTEWWHFNACSRVQAMMKYKILKSEP